MQPTGRSLRQSRLRSLAEDWISLPARNHQAIKAMASAAAAADATAAGPERRCAGAGVRAIGNSATASGRNAKTCTDRTMFFTLCSPLSWQMRLVSTFSCSCISRQASAIESATPLGLQAPGLMITNASRKRLPWGRVVSDMSDVSVKERECS
jgi:hypothetical protein